jgi:hypothetical protein
MDYIESLKEHGGVGGIQFRDNDFEMKVRLKRDYINRLCDKCDWRDVED